MGYTKNKKRKRLFYKRKEREKTVQKGEKRWSLVSGAQKSKSEAELDLEKETVSSILAGTRCWLLTASLRLSGCSEAPRFEVLDGAGAVDDLVMPN